MDIKKLREKLEWTQDKLASFLAYTGRSARAQVSNIEKGRTSPGPAVKRLLELLKIYGKNAPKLWEAGVAKRVEQILNKEEDGS